MNTKLISKPALDTIDQYMHFRVGQAECAVPYFNNKHKRQRIGLRAAVGKGSPKEILDEVEIAGMKEKTKPETWTDILLKKFMCDEDIGIDCSGLAFYVLSAESKARGKGSLDRHLAFPDRNFLKRLKAKLRPVENTDVLVFANDKNSISIDLQKIEPGDFIAMIGTDTERNHILIIHEVDYQNFSPIAIHYTHSIAWSDDGQYGHGVRQGLIEVLEPTKGLLDQKWTEKEKTGAENQTYSRAKISRTEIRRLNRWN
jgi:hypothetical protein